MALACRVTSLSIDSRFADQYYDGTAEFMIRLPSIMRNVSRIALTSIELPQVAYVFSAKLGNTGFFIDMGGVRYERAIPDGNYTPSQLATAVTVATAVGGVDVSYNSITNRISVSVAGGVPVVLTLASASALASRTRYWGLGYWLGFREQTVFVGAGSTVAAPQAPQTAPPAYAFVQVQYPDMAENTVHRTDAGSFVQALAKVVLRPSCSGSLSYTIQYDDGANFVNKETVFPSATAISQLRIRLVDAYGISVDMGDIDWSMTLEVTEIVNALARC